MPRFHFDVLGKDGFIDSDGIEFDDAGTMRTQAMRAAGAMIGEMADFPPEPWTMVIRDERRQAVATLSFVARPT